MGTSEIINKNKNDSNKIDNKGKKSEKMNRNEINNSTEINKISNRIEENTIQSSDKDSINFFISKVSKAICKITTETSEGNINGIGFLLKFFINQEEFYCLISNEHVITKDAIKNKNMIYITYDNGLKGAYKRLDEQKRYIKSFSDIDLDITVVEILDEDNISKDYFLLPEFECRVNNELINKEIYVTHYLNDNNLKVTRSLIKEINKSGLTHQTSLEPGSSGCPIFLKDRTSILGIQKEGSKDQTENYGDFIYPAINIIKDNIIKKRNQGKYLDGKYIWEDGKYYLGEFQNNLPNGKGIKYYSNGSILYDGNFVNGKFEG